MYPRYDRNLQTYKYWKYNKITLCRERERERERERKRERQRERDRERKNFILTRTVRSYGNGEIYDYDSWLFINAQLYRVNSLRENDICT